MVKKLLINLSSVFPWKSRYGTCPGAIQMIFFGSAFVPNKTILFPQKWPMRSLLYCGSVGEVLSGVRANQTPPSGQDAYRLERTAEGDEECSEHTGRQLKWPPTLSSDFPPNLLAETIIRCSLSNIGKWILVLLLTYGKSISCIFAARYDLM